MNCTNIDFASGAIPPHSRLCLARRLTGSTPTAAEAARGFQLLEVAPSFSRSFAGCGLGRGRRLGQNICLNQLHLVRFQRVFERRHAAGFANAAQHDGLKLVVGLRGGIAKVRHTGAGDDTESVQE